MKKIIASASILAASVSLLCAGGIDNKTNLNTGYHRNPSRNTENKRPEAVFYNIAGTAFMDDGLYCEIGDQIVFKKYQNKFMGEKYKDEKTVPFYPNAELVYKKDNWALFFGFGVFGGGGSLEYNKGTALTAGLLNYGITSAITSNAAASSLFASAGIKPSTVGMLAAKDHSIDIYSIQLGEIVGLSVRPCDFLSIAIAGRFLHGEQNMTLKCDTLSMLGNGGSEISYKAEGFSIGGMFGVHVKPVKNLDIALQYQSITRIDYKFNEVKGNLAPTLLGGDIKGKNFKNDLPAVLNFGAGYTFFDRLDVSGSFNYYFNHFARIENPIDRSEYEYDNSWELAFGADFMINEKFSVGAGLSYGNTGFRKRQNSVFSPVLDSVVYGAGVEFTPVEMITFACSGMYCNYFDAEYRTALGDMNLSKDLVMISFGITVKPF